MNKLYGALLAVSISIVLWTVPAFAHTADEPFVTDLIAGRHMDVGDVLVWNDADYLYVKYVTIADWCLTQTRLHIATDIDGMPQTEKGNHAHDTR